MIVIDSSALIAILRREPEVDAFLQVIATAEKCLLSVVSFLETSLVLAGRPHNVRIWQPLDALIAEADIEIVAHDTVLAKIARAGFLAFGKGRHPAQLNFGDCASYALAKSLGAPLLFKGSDFLATDLTAAC